MLKEMAKKDRHRNMPTFLKEPLRFTPERLFMLWRRTAVTRRSMSIDLERSCDVNKLTHRQESHDLFILPGKIDRLTPFGKTVFFQIAYKVPPGKIPIFGDRIGLFSVGLNNLEKSHPSPESEPWGRVREAGCSLSSSRYSLWTRRALLIQKSICPKTKTFFS